MDKNAEKYILRSNREAVFEHESFILEVDWSTILLVGVQPLPTLTSHTLSIP